jgi:hypothetical protein
MLCSEAFHALTWSEAQAAQEIAEKMVKARKELLEAKAENEGQGEEDQGVEQQEMDMAAAMEGVDMPDMQDLLNILGWGN